MKLKLAGKKPEDAGATTFYFQPEDPIEWEPGQYLRYHIDNPHPDARGNNRFFSIASAPFEHHIQLTTKFSKSDGSAFKQFLQGMQINQEIEAFGPSGYFTAEDLNPELVLIAGGMGITPFRAILLDLDHKGEDINAILLYTNHTQDAVFKEELENLTKKHPNFKIYYIISDATMEIQMTDNIKVIPGRINKTLLKSLIINPKSSITYISGPESMVMDLERVIWDMGIPRENTRQDYFSGYEDY